MNLLDSNKFGGFRGKSTGKDMNEYLKKVLRETATFKKFNNYRILTNCIDKCVTGVTNIMTVLRPIIPLFTHDFYQADYSFCQMFKHLQQRQIVFLYFRV